MSTMDTRGTEFLASIFNLYMVAIDIFVKLGRQ